MEMIEFETTLIEVDGQVWYAALQVPAEKVKPLVGLNDNRVICKINNQVSFQCALMPAGNGDFFINTNKEIRKKLALNIGDKVQIALQTDNSEYGMPVPEELTTAWELDEEANKVFHSLTKGKQRALIHSLGKIKNAETRIKKILVMLEYLKSVNGKLDFKELNEAFKQAKNE